nr:MAG TPA: hypothetical protein [Caudoviricetes sp.]
MVVLSQGVFKQRIIKCKHFLYSSSIGGCTTVLVVWSLIFSLPF